MVAGGSIGLGEIARLAATALASAMLTAVLIAAAFPLLQRYALARPNARSSHKTPTAQGGGAPVIAATLAVAWVMFGMGNAGSADGLSERHLAALSVAVIGLAVLGAIDDIRPLPVLPRLGLQFAAAALLVAAVPASMRALSPIPSLIESVILTVGLVWFVNLTNFMDGIDGITVAEMTPIAGVIVLASLAGVVPWPGGVLASALAGALLAFAPWNRHVARLFLGDVGSLAIGALVGWLLILLAGNGDLAAALILPMYYLADATLTLWRRYRRGERLTDAHRTHYYQRATTQAGRRIPDVTRAVLLANLMLAGLALLTLTAQSVVIDGIALAAAGILTWRLLRHLVPRQLEVVA